MVLLAGLAESWQDARFIEVTFTAEAGRAYFVIVDGYEGATGSFPIGVSCS